LLSKLGTGAAASDSSAINADLSTSVILISEFKKMLEFGFVILHEVEVVRFRTGPRNGLYKVRVWVEAVSAGCELSEISSVTYQLWHDFPTPQMTTADLDSSFDLWLKIYGEFPVMAIVTKKDGECSQLVRYIDLPGRPED
jgi:hypothetical protein